MHTHYSEMAFDFNCICWELRRGDRDPNKRRIYLPKYIYAKFLFLFRYFGGLTTSISRKRISSERPRSRQYFFISRHSHCFENILVDWILYYGRAHQCYDSMLILIAFCDDKIEFLNKIKSVNRWNETQQKSYYYYFTFAFAIDCTESVQFQKIVKKIYYKNVDAKRNGKPVRGSGTHAARQSAR